MTEEKNQKKSFLSLFEESEHSHCCSGHHHTNGHHFPGMPKEDEENFEDMDEDSLTDEIDHEILMHRDSHFAGDFSTMLNYYKGENPGINPDFDLERIEYLEAVEKELGQNLASLLLTGPEAEHVGRARDAYKKLKQIYEINHPKNAIPQLIADLILTEKEDPQDEINAIVEKGTEVVPELIRILKNDDSFDPLFPGYGMSPFLAIVCLGLIKDERAVIPLFETLGRSMVFEEEIILDALAELGEPAKEFLLKVLVSKPLTDDNVNAAFAVLAFRQEEEVSKACLKLLEDPAIQKHHMLANYLACACEGLKNPDDQKQFALFVENSNLDEELRRQIKAMIQEWK